MEPSSRVEASSSVTCCVHKNYKFSIRLTFSCVQFIHGTLMKLKFIISLVLELRLWSQQLLGKTMVSGAKMELWSVTLLPLWKPRAVENMSSLWRVTFKTLYLCDWIALGKHEWSKNIQPNVCHWQLKLEACLIFSSGRVAVSENATSCMSIWLVKQEGFCVMRHLISGGMGSSSWRAPNFFCWKLLKFTLASETRPFVRPDPIILRNLIDASQVNLIGVR